MEVIRQSENSTAEKPTDPTLEEPVTCLCSIIIEFGTRPSGGVSSRDRSVSRAETVNKLPELAPDSLWSSLGGPASRFEKLGRMGTKTEKGGKGKWKNTLWHGATRLP